MDIFVSRLALSLRPGPITRLSCELFHTHRRQQRSSDPEPVRRERIDIGTGTGRCYGPIYISSIQHRSDHVKICYVYQGRRAHEGSVPVSAKHVLGGSLIAAQITFVPIQADVRILRSNPATLIPYAVKLKNSLRPRTAPALHGGPRQLRVTCIQRLPCYYFPKDASVIELPLQYPASATELAPHLDS